MTGATVELRCSEHGAHQLLQIRTAVANEEFEQFYLPSHPHVVPQTIEVPLAA
jgi:hypothetical protein